MAPKPILLLTLLLFLFLSCEEWDLEEEDFLKVEFLSIDSLSIDSIQLTAQIQDLNGAQVQEHGFLWTTEDREPLILINEGNQNLGIKTATDNPLFSSVLELEPNTPYTLRAYASIDGVNYFYSDPIIYSTGSGAAFTLGYTYLNGLKVEMTGRISGTEKGFVALQHGFCWSTEKETPTLEDQSFNLGVRRNNDLFSFVYDSLENDKVHYLRAYAILSLNSKWDTVYGQVLTFDEKLNFWTRKTGFVNPIASSNGFAIGQKGYLIPTNNNQSLEYDPETDSWTDITIFPGESSSRPVAFSVGQKAYLGIGASESVFAIPFTREWWEYNPETNTWTQLSDFPGTMRSGAVGFSIGEKGYMGTGAGIGTSFRDFWEYDPILDSWTRKADLPGLGRSQAVGFSIGEKGYIGTGLIFTNGITLKDFWEYDPVANSWTRKAAVPGDPRFGAIGFSIGEKGYIGTGAGTGIAFDDFWEYDPVLDTWLQRADFAGGAGAEAISFSIGLKGYIGTTTVFGATSGELWEFDPGL